MRTPGRWRRFLCLYLTGREKKEKEEKKEMFPSYSESQEKKKNGRRRIGNPAFQARGGREGKEKARRPEKRGFSYRKEKGKEIGELSPSHTTLSWTEGRRKPREGKESPHCPPSSPPTLEKGEGEKGGALLSRTLPNEKGGGGGQVDARKCKDQPPPSLS